MNILKGQKDIVISPYSTGVCTAMVLSASDNDTRKEMCQAMGIDPECEEVSCASTRLPPSTLTKNTTVFSLSSRTRCGLTSGLRMHTRSPVSTISNPRCSSSQTRTPSTNGFPIRRKFPTSSKKILKDRLC